MKDSLRTVVAGAVGAVIASAVMIGQPALADALKTAPKNSVNSKSIKDGSVKTKDLAADVNGALAKANSALQSIPDNAVTNPKLADNAVGSAEVAADSLTAADLAANSVGASELANGAVDGPAVEDHSLAIADFSARSGFAQVAVPALAINACANLSFDIGAATGFGGQVVVNPNILAADGIQVEAARIGSPSDIVDFRVCNRGAAAFSANDQTFLWMYLI